MTFAGYPIIIDLWNRECYNTARMPQQHDSPPASSSSASAVDTAADISLSGPHPDSSASVLFSGHDEYIASVARTCRELELYTDVNIVAQDGTVAAHRSRNLLVTNFTSFTPKNHLIE